MIEILQVTDEQKRQEILNREKIKNADAVVLAMNDGAGDLGYAVINIEKDIIYILKLCADGYHFENRPDAGQVFVLDSLLRAAASYGETFYAQYIETTFSDFYDFFRLRRFDVSGGICKGSVSLIVKYS